MRLMIEFHNHSRQWCICGWKPVELVQRYKPQGKPAITFGPGMQKAFDSGDMDREEMLRQFRTVGLNVEDSKTRCLLDNPRPAPCKIRFDLP